MIPNLPEMLVLPLEMGQVVVNLLNNAIEALYFKNGNSSIDFEPRIDVKSEYMDDEVLITVRDNGCGISPENLSRIFTPFFSTKRKNKANSGLGLALTKEIVEKDHEGGIEVNSVEGEYTEFIIRLPIRKAEDVNFSEMNMVS